MNPRIIKLGEKFVHAAGFIKEGEGFFTDTPHPESATFLVAWIMDRYVVPQIQVVGYIADLYLSCDDIGLDGKPKDANIPRDSYSHAQKMRAAATYGFGRLHGLGSLPWQKSELSGNMLGNPSISETVSRYMVSLRKKKVGFHSCFDNSFLIPSILQVRAGEVATSARAITPVCFLINFEA